MAGACERLLAWLAGNGWASYDPYDAANSPLASIFARISPLAMRLFVQVVKASPVNLRACLGVQPTISPKSVGLLASGYVRLHWRKLHLEREAHKALEWLITERLPGYSGACWGYPFSVQTRGTAYVRGTPTVVATSFIAQAFLDAYEELGDALYLEVARSACDFVMCDLPALACGAGICIPYHPKGPIRVHNANMLGVALLARVYYHTAERCLFDYARRALRGTLSRQRPDGAWHYGEEPGLHWIDGFHTGFVLDGLYHYLKSTGDGEPAVALQRGLDYYHRHLFLAHGVPKYADNRLYPIDVRCAAQAIQTFSLVGDWFPAGHEFARTVARWTIQHMQAPAGYFYYQIHRPFVIKTPFLRWSQGPMLCALATLLTKERHLAGKYRSSEGE